MVALSGLASEVGHVVRMGCAYMLDKRTIRAVAPIENATATTSRREIVMKLAVRVTLVEDRSAHILSALGDSSIMKLSGSVISVSMLSEPALSVVVMCMRSRCSTDCRLVVVGGLVFMSPTDLPENELVSRQAQD